MKKCDTEWKLYENYGEIYSLSVLIELSAVGIDDLCDDDNKLKDVINAIHDGLYIRLVFDTQFNAVREFALLGNLFNYKFLKGVIRYVNYLVGYGAILYHNSLHNVSKSNDQRSSVEVKIAVKIEVKSQNWG